MRKNGAASVHQCTSSVVSQENSINPPKNIKKKNLKKVEKPDEESWSLPATAAADSNEKSKRSTLESKSTISENRTERGHGRGSIRSNCGNFSHKYRITLINLSLSRVLYV